MIKINELVNVVGMPTLEDMKRMFAVDNNEDLTCAVKAYGILVNSTCNVEKVTKPAAVKAPKAPKSK